MPIALIIILVVIFLIAAWLIGVYNGLVKLKNMVQNSWSQIDVQLKRRFDLIPNLVETVKGYATHEKEVFSDVAKARSMVESASTVEDRSKAEGGLTNALRHLFAVSESYPELKANENFKALQDQLTDLESKIAFARQFYNDIVMKYNTKMQSFPTNLIEGTFGFSSVAYFEVENAAERQNVSVKF